MIDDSASDISDDWGPGYNDLNEAQKQILDDLKTKTSAKDLVAKKEEYRKKFNHSLKLINDNMLAKWNTHINQVNVIRKN